MVKVTTKYLFRKLAKKNHLQPRKKEEFNLEHLKRMTHLHLQSQFIDKISSVPECQSISVIYLQNNLLHSIENMENFPNITHLYLQHNFISKIENLDQLSSLKKLYLGNNEISVVEGLEKLTNLIELHLENQRLPQGETLYFDPLTVARLRNSLKVLNVSNNSISSIGWLTDLVSLNKLIIRKNQINDLEEVVKALSKLAMLEEFDSEDNPVVSDRKFFDAVVFSSKSLKKLNGKDINESTKLFIRKFEQRKALRNKAFEFSMRGFKSNEKLENQRHHQSLDEMVFKSSARLESKVFPVLKIIADNRKNNVLQLPQKLKPLYRNSLNVSRLSSSENYFS